MSLATCSWIRSSAIRAASFHLDRIESGVAADVEHTFPVHVRQLAFEAAELLRRIITEEMIRRGPHPPQVHVVEPGPKRLDSLLKIVARNCAELGFGKRHAQVNSEL